jgi:Bacteriophage related domain of unknown function
MSSPEAFLAVRDLIEAEFSLCPVVWPNEQTPTDSSMPWVYIDVTGSLTRRIELGIGAYEEVGLIWCHVFVPVGTGSTEARTIVKALSRIFLLARDSPVRFGDQSAAQGNPGDDDGMLWRQTMTVDYSYQETV